MKIYGYAASINVRKVLWACEELGLAFEREDWGGGFRSTSDPAFATAEPDAGYCDSSRMTSFVPSTALTRARYGTGGIAMKLNS
jgi:hypothetical protein